MFVAGVGRERATISSLLSPPMVWDITTQKLIWIIASLPLHSPGRTVSILHTSHFVSLETGRTQTENLSKNLTICQAELSRMDICPILAIRSIKTDWIISRRAPPTIRANWRCFSESQAGGQHGQVVTTENRSSSESGYGTSLGEARQDVEQDEVFCLEEEEELPLQYFRPQQSQFSVGVSSTNFQFWIINQIYLLPLLWLPKDLTGQGNSMHTYVQHK